MFKKILIATLFVSGSCAAMDSPRGQFLDFVRTEIATGLATVRERIAANAEGDGSFNELSGTFVERFGGCFEGTAVPIPSSYMYSNTLFTAARAVGLAYLKDGEGRKNIQSLNVALAFFQSVPKETAPTEGADECSVELIEIARKAKEDIEQRELKFQQIRDSNPSEFFK